MSNTYEVKVKFDQDFTKKIDRLASTFDESRGNIISKCIDIGDKVINEILSGNNVIIERKDGQRVEYTF